MKLERSIDNLVKKLDRLDPQFSSSSRTGLNHWKDKPIISLDEWIKFRDTHYILDYFPNDFDQSFIYLSAKDDLEKGRERKDMEKCNSNIYLFYLFVIPTHSIVEESKTKFGNISDFDLPTG